MIFLGIYKTEEKKPIALGVSDDVIEKAIANHTAIISTKPFDEKFVVERTSIPYMKGTFTFSIMLPANT